MIDGKDAVSERLNVKTLDQMFVSMVERGYECPPFVSNAILDTAKTVFVPDQNKDTVNVGQMKVIGVHAKEPAGKKLEECEMKAAIVTIDAGREDEEVRVKYGLPELRRLRLTRIANEARDQGVLLTQEDLAYKVLACDVRTIRRDIVALAERGIHVSTRGQQKDIGRGTCHRIRAVDLYMERESYTDIAREIRHSLDAIKRYITAFARIAFLTRRGDALHDIAFLVQISPNVVKKYQALYEEYNAREGYRDRLEEVLEIAEPYQDDKKGAMRWA